MLAKINRLKKKNDFDRVFKTGRGFKEGFLYFKLARNNLTINRFGFIVSKKFSLKATVRNRVKRKITEVIRIISPRLKKGIDVVIIVLPGFQVNDIWELEGIVENLFRKSGVLIHENNKKNIS